jgi:Ca-activated chloride channel homolog
MRGRGRIPAAAIALVLAGSPAFAAESCALELILAVDVSGSIDDREFALQMEGMAAAFEDPQLIEAVQAQRGGVLVTLTQWSGASRQRQVTGWRLLRDEGSMAAFAHEIRGSGRDWRNYSTAIGEALYHALAVGETAPQACRRRVIDVSGDGVNNEGRAPRPMADALAAIGYTVNGLVIRGDKPDPVRHYEVNVLAGPRAFMEIASSFDDYPEAIRRKLLREVEERALVARLDGD